MQLAKTKIRDFLDLVSRTVAVPLESIYEDIVKFDGNLETSIASGRTVFSPFMRTFEELVNTYIGLEDDGSFYGYLSRFGKVPYNMTYMLTVRKDSNDKDKSIMVHYTINEQGNPVNYFSNLTYDPRLRPWFIKAKEKMETVWTSPYFSATLSMPMITLAAPVINNTYSAGYLTKPYHFYGTLASDVSLMTLSTFLKNSIVLNKDEAFIVDRATGYLLGSSNGADLFTVKDDGSKVMF
jgi:hypothetical protein